MLMNIASTIYLRVVKVFSVVQVYVSFDSKNFCCRVNKSISFITSQEYLLRRQRQESSHYHKTHASNIGLFRITLADCVIS